MGVAVADYDDDGWFDIYKGNFSDDAPNLYHNNGDGTFTDVAAAAGLAADTEYVRWGCGFVDFDNDGWPDLIQVNGHVYPEVDEYHLTQGFKQPRVLYRNCGDGTFRNVSDQAGPGIGARYSSRGCALGDYDNDGDIDILVSNLNDYPSLLRNDGGNRNNWLKVKLVGSKCNRTAIGARVRVTVGKHTQMDEVHSGTSVMSQNDLRLHFGLGQAQSVNLLEVKWPTTQQIEKFTNVEPNQILTIQEGHGIVKTYKPGVS
jgi:enediyne biosynthesis protein E4